MDGLRIVFLFFSSFIFFYALWLGFFSLVGILTKPKRYPDTEAHMRFAVLIAAKDEAATIRRLLQSLKKQTYPQDNYTVFVVAHNCTDATASLAAGEGITVFIDDNENEKTKADALRYGFAEIAKIHPSAFDGYVVFDADAIPDSGFLAEMNRAFQSGADVVSGNCLPLNFRDTTVSRLAGFLYTALMKNNSAPRNRLGLPVNIYGSGWGARMDTLSYFSGLSTLVEDFEFSLRAAMQKKKMVYAPYAVFRAEMPRSILSGVRQRYRWAMGDTQCFRRYFFDMLRLLPHGGLFLFTEFMDFILNPVVTVSLCGFLGLCVTGMLPITGNLRVLLPEAICFYLIFSVAALFSYPESEKIRKTDLPAILLFPLWMFLSAPLGCISMFRKTVSWKRTERCAEGNDTNTQKEKR